MSIYVFMCIFVYDVRYSGSKMPVNERDVFGLYEFTIGNDMYIYLYVYICIHVYICLCIFVIVGQRYL
jgi:hypothetical protein